MTKELQDKFAELIDRLKAVEEAVYDGPDDTDALDGDDFACDDDDCCCDDNERAWKETDPFVERLHHLSTSQLEHLLEEAEWILEERHQQGQEYVCPECRAKAEAEDNDGYCEQCNDYHDLPDDDDEDVTEDVQKVVNDVPGKNQPREIDTTDGVFSEFAAYVAAHPEQRFFQAIRNFSGFNFIFGSIDTESDNYSQLVDTFNLRVKGPKKGAPPAHGNA